MSIVTQRYSPVCSSEPSLKAKQKTEKEDKHIFGCKSATQNHAKIQNNIEQDENDIFLSVVYKKK